MHITPTVLSCIENITVNQWYRFPGFILQRPQEGTRIYSAWSFIVTIAHLNSPGSRRGLAIEELDVVTIVQIHLRSLRALLARSWWLGKQKQCINQWEVLHRFDVTATTKSSKRYKCPLLTFRPRHNKSKIYTNPFIFAQRLIRRTLRDSSSAKHLERGDCYS